MANPETIITSLRENATRVFEVCQQDLTQAIQDRETSWPRRARPGSRTGLTLSRATTHLSGFGRRSGGDADHEDGVRFGQEEVAGNPNEVTLWLQYILSTRRP